MKVLLKEIQKIKELIINGQESSALDLIMENGLRGDERVEGDEDRWTIMHLASRFGMHEILEKCVKRGADPEVGDVFGMTPLMFHKDLKTAEVLMMLGADPDRKCNSNNTALMVLERTEDEDYVEDFVKLSLKAKELHEEWKKRSEEKSEFEEMVGQGKMKVRSKL